MKAEHEEQVARVFAAIDLHDPTAALHRSSQSCIEEFPLRETTERLRFPYFEPRGTRPPTAVVHNAANPFRLPRAFRRGHDVFGGRRTANQPFRPPLIATLSQPDAHRLTVTPRRPSAIRPAAEGFKKVSRVAPRCQPRHSEDAKARFRSGLSEAAGQGLEP